MAQRYMDQPSDLRVSTLAVNKFASVSVSSPPEHTPSRRETRCLSWSNLTLSAMIPLMIGIFTVVAFVLQQRNEDRRRQQDQEIANLTRQKDMDLANLTRQQDLRFEEDRRKQDQHQADDLHYQGIFKSYIEDISDILFKQHNDDTFINNQTRLNYIRSKTLTALEELDSGRKTRLFVFLYENDLLPRILPISDGINLSLDLSSSNLSYISLKRSLYKKFIFKKLNLPEVDLTNASFIGCEFHSGVNFRDSLMDNVKFTSSRFECSKQYLNSGIGTLGTTHVLFDHSVLVSADFHGSFLCDVSFNGTDLTNANFSNVRFQGKLHFEGSNLANTNFYDSQTLNALSMNIVNSNMVGAVLGSSLTEDIDKGNLYMNNVILPNGTWSINESNLVLNGNAELNRSGILPLYYIPHWQLFDMRYYAYPSLSTSKLTQMSKSFLGDFYFNFTVQDKRKVVMTQGCDLNNFSMFIDSGDAVYNFSADVNCLDGEIAMGIRYYDATMTQLTFSASVLSGSTIPFEWVQWRKSYKIPVSTRRLSIELHRIEGGGLCFMDNIELRIQRGEHDTSST